MAPIQQLLIADWDFRHAPDWSSAGSEFVADRNIAWDFISSHWAAFVAAIVGVAVAVVDYFSSLNSEFMEWLCQPHVMLLISVWWITFTIVVAIILSLGFGPAGVVAGSLAAWFQSYMYGGATPAGGLFATLTSVAMLGVLAPWAVVPGVILATTAVLIASLMM